ncbi:glycosyltransferase [Blastopirellula sp. JC732]|uniref:Glycosyltransferase n=1 Tax=Blastopirellula sediminis TaxID=2894196 RepID=A0A9X1SJA8_9BACT|nr:glycosyltransferase [Blastopirellula sediminis]MCC9608439.1 glycosyltransferase [Blastopirellula sediminis]MCC9628784.1 glycosyltransferase [Blastopirellula sediminis]
MSVPKVSVCIITYNHERYIRQAIESVLRQKTSFPIEIVIGEDCSTDKTRSIVEEAQKQESERIKLLKRDANVGMMRNFLETYHACRGDFIALLEGDDYWTDPGKLQRQVELLESHPNWSLCFHSADYVDGKGRSLGYRHPQSCNETLDVGEIAKRNYVQTCSVMVRRSMLPQLPDYFLDLKLGDWPLCILAAKQGPLGYCDAPMAAYRVHDGGVWTSGANDVKIAAVIDMYLRVLRDNPDLHEEIRDAIASDRQEAIAWLQESLELQTKSWTWRVGSMVTWPARALHKRIALWFALAAIWYRFTSFD